MSLSVRIVTPTREAYHEAAADKIFGPGFYGEFGLLQDHARFVTLSRPGVLKVHIGGNVSKMFVGKGFAEASENTIVYLVDVCEPVESIDKEAAQKGLEDAQAAIKGLTIEDSGYNLLLDKIELASARLEA